MTVARCIRCRCPIACGLLCARHLADTQQAIGVIRGYPYVIDAGSYRQARHYERDVKRHQQMVAEREM